MQRGAAGDGVWGGWGTQTVLLHPSARERCRDEHHQEPGLGCGRGGSLGACRRLGGADAPWHGGGNGGGHGGVLQPWPWLPTAAPSPGARSLARPETCVSSGSLSKMPTTGKQRKPKLSFCLDSHQFPELNNRLFQASLLQLFWLFGLSAVSWAKQPSGLEEEEGEAALWDEGFACDQTLPRGLPGA